MVDDGNRLCELARVRHRQVDRLRADVLGPGGDAAREPHARLGPADDLDVLPRERARDAEAERLAHRLLAGEAPGVALRRIRTRVAVLLLGLGEAAVAKTRVPRERAADAFDLDEIGADARAHPCSSSQAGSCEIEETIPSGRTRDRSTASGRNFPVRTSTVRRLSAWAPAMSLSRSSPTIHASSGSVSSSSHAASKYDGLGLPSTIASTSAAYSRPATNAPESSSGPSFVCHQRFLCSA